MHPPPPAPAPDALPAPTRHAAAGSSWKTAALLFALASFVETFGFGHVGAFTPLYLEQLGLPPEAIPQWTGILAAVSFLLGFPLAPFWGVWADRYSRKLIIVRSTVGEGLIFFLMSIASEPWHLLIARMLVGFILGNTGVMYASLSDVALRRQLATAIGIVSAGSTLGFTVGPFVGGWLVTQIGIAPLYQLDAAVCWGVALLLVLRLREGRRSSPSHASTLELLKALPGHLRGSPAVLPLFGLYYVAFLGLNMQGPFVPLLVADVYQGSQLPVAIGGVMLAMGLISAVCSPVLGQLGGRLGHRPVLIGALVIGAVAAIGQALAPDYASLLAGRAALGLVQGGMGPQIVSMIALATPEDRRGSVLNLTLFPTNFAHFSGALIGSAIAALSLRGVFAAGSGVLLVAGGMVAAVGRLGADAPTGRNR